MDGKEKRKQNLRKITSEEAKEMQKISIARRNERTAERKIFKETIQKLLTDKDYTEMIYNLFERAKNNDKSFEVLRDTMGQKPTETQEIKAETDSTFNVNIKVVE